MTKAERIRKLAAKHPKWSTKQIAAECDCRPEYVRVVLRQRTGGMSEIDRRYVNRIIDQHGAWPNTIKYRTDEEFRERIKTHKAKWQRENRERCNAYHRDHRARKKAEREAAHA